MRNGAASPMPDQAQPERVGRRAFGLVGAAACGLVGLALVCVLWASEGASVFLTQAFAALAACF